MRYDARYDVRFVEGKTLIFPEITVDDAFADGFFEDGGGIEAIGGEGTGVSTFVEEALFVGAVGGHFGGISLSASNKLRSFNRD